MILLPVVNSVQSSEGTVVNPGSASSDTSVNINKPYYGEIKKVSLDGHSREYITPTMQKNALFAKYGGPDDEFPNYPVGLLCAFAVAFHLPSYWEG